MQGASLSIPDVCVLGNRRPSLLLSAATVSSLASVGTTIGNLSVVNGIGSYTYTFTSNPGTLFSISGSSLQVAAALSPGSDAITIQANNGAGSIVSQSFLITVVNGSYVPTFELLGF